jgi:hypothetical protein
MVAISGQKSAEKNNSLWRDFPFRAGRLVFAQPAAFDLNPGCSGLAGGPPHQKGFGRWRRVNNKTGRHFRAALT